MRGIFAHFITFAAGIFVASTVTIATAGGFPTINFASNVSLKGNVLTVNGHSQQLAGNPKVVQLKAFEVISRQFDEIFVAPTHWSTSGIAHSVPQPATTPVPAQPTVVIAQGCPAATSTTYSTATTFTVSGPAIVQPWWNNGLPSWGQAQVRLEVLAGQSVTLNQAMGVSYVYQNTPACSASLDQQFGNSSFPIVTISQLQSQHLAN